MFAELSTLFYPLYLLILSVNCIQELDFKYHNHEALTSILKKWNETESNSSLHWNLSSIGESVWGEKLWVFEMSAAPPETTGIPNMKFIGNMHGNHEAGREVLLHFIEHLMTSYGKDENVTHLLDTTRIYVLPSMNPDGSKLLNSRPRKPKKLDIQPQNNARDIDLNTNFPDYYQENPQKSLIQPETQAIMNWMNNIQFTLSANLDGSAIVAYYPFNSLKEYKSFQGQQESLTEDNDVFVHLATLYSKAHANMYKGIPCPDTHGNGDVHPSYPGGITNGAFIESVIGSMQDYNYFKHGCMELYLKISCHKQDASLKQIWNDNKKALEEYALQANRGVHGIIRDLNTNARVPAKLSIEGRNIEFNTTKDGEFWRILLPGTYNLKVSSEGYYQTILPFTINDTGRFPKLQHLNVFLLNSTIPTTPATVQTTNATEDGSFTMTTIDIVESDYGSNAPKAEGVKSTSTQYFVSFSLVIVCLLGRFIY